MKDESWTYLGTGNVVRWDGDLYIVKEVRHFAGLPEKDHVVLMPLNAANCSTHVSRTFPYDEFAFDVDTGEKALVKKAVRLEGIEYVARHVEELIMRRIKKFLFS